MADYYPLLSRAVRNLPRSSPETRQGVFVRARDALERQLRSLTPQLSEADIVRELLSLEDVIKRIEREIADEDEAAAQSLRRIEEAAGKLALDDAGATAPQGAASLPPDEVEHPTIRPAPPAPRPRAEIRPVEDLRPAAEPAPEAPALPEGLPAPSLLVTDAGANGRIRMPSGEDGAKRKQRLRLFAVAGLVAILGMGVLAMSNRGSPDRYRTAAADPPVVAPAGDTSKREGRLGAGEAPQPSQAPAQPPAPEAPPQRQVTSVPIQAPLNTPPSAQPEQPALPVVSRAFMIMEVPGRPPNQYEGQANWSFAPDPLSRSPEKALLTSIEFAAAGVKIDIAMVRAADASLNASHIVTLAFTPNAGLPGIREMSAVEWREREGQPGVTLAGTLVPIQDNLFMIGLDATDAGRARNLDLLRNQRWMVFEIRLADQRRGAFLVEKGSSGEKAIAEALAAWR
jgi:hypothetical protein